MDQMNSLRFSANLGFLWTELCISDAIYSAADAGFDGIEMHWPQSTDIEAIQAALVATKLPLVSLNTKPGDKEIGDFGLCAVPGRREDALQAIDLAIEQALALDAKFIHVMAGNATGDAAHETFVANLKYALLKLASTDLKVLIEPINEYDVPDYFLKTPDQAKSIINEIGSNKLKMMFDFYHVERQSGDAIARFLGIADYVGHVQIASVPDRASPDHGALNFEHVFECLESTWNGFIGAEYRPRSATLDSLNWLSDLRSGRDITNAPK